MLAKTAMICSQQPSTSQDQLSKQMPSPHVRQVVALAVISRLHEWCVQLFWITILCVIGCVGDEKQKCSALHLQEQRTKQKREERTTKTTKSIAEIEMKLLRHLTSPQYAALRPVVKHSKKRHNVASRPPSPQLFDISEEPEEL